MNSHDPRPQGCGGPTFRRGAPKAALWHPAIAALSGADRYIRARQMGLRRVMGVNAGSMTTQSLAAYAQNNCRLSFCFTFWFAPGGSVALLR